MSTEKIPETKNTNKKSNASPPLTALNALFANLNAREFRKKNEAIKKLGRIKNPKAREKLLEIASSSQWNTRLRVSALDSLGRGAKDYNLINLLQTLANDQKQDKEIRRACITQISRLRDPKVVPTLIAALDDPYHFIRFWAVRGLLKIDDPKSFTGLVKAMGDEDEEIRKTARIHLESVGAKAAPALIEAMNSKESNKFVRYGSVGLLGRVSDPKALKALIAILNDENERVITIALRGLARIGSIDAVLPLLDLYRKKNKHRRLIEDALFRIGQENEDSLVTYLVSLLSDGDPDMVNLAINTFKKFGNSYSILGDLLSDKKLPEDFKDNIKSAMKQL
ncbi:MAG: HEAT repeat domain-containing protein [Promethearchaeota archaeon]